MTKDDWRAMWKNHEQLRERIKAAIDAGNEPFVGLAEAVEIGDDQLIEHSVDLIEQSLSRHQV